MCKIGNGRIWLTDFGACVLICSVITRIADIFPTVSLPQHTASGTSCYTCSSGCQMHCPSPSFQTPCLCLFFVSFFLSLSKLTPSLTPCTSNYSPSLPTFTAALFLLLHYRIFARFLAYVLAPFQSMAVRNAVFFTHQLQMLQSIQSLYYTQEVYRDMKIYFISTEIFPKLIICLQFPVNSKRNRKQRMFLHKICRPDEKPSELCTRTQQLSNFT